MTIIRHFLQQNSVVVRQVSSVYDEKFEDAIPKNVRISVGALSVNIPSIWLRQPGDFFCISIRSPSGKWTDNFFSREEFREVRDLVRSHADSNVYFCPHGFSRRRRQKQYAVLPKLCYADLDEADPRTFELKPTIVLETSPGRYAGFWLTDKPITESLNRRLTYEVRADKGGWDLTQVLRYPGTINHKYKDNPPRVKTLWDDGPIYTIRELERTLPEEEIEDEDTGLDYEEVYDKYQKKFEPWLRTAILHGRSVEGKRSDMLWRMENSLLEMGVSQDEAFVLIKYSAWNKYVGRYNEDDQIRAELEKAKSKKLNGHVVKTNGLDLDEDLVNMADVEEEELDWIWYPFLAKGELSILEGDPGIGKSYLAQMIGLYIADGRSLPTLKPQGKKPVQGPVLYFDMENSPKTVTIRRLRDNGIKHGENYNQCKKFFTIDMDWAQDYIKEKLDAVKPVLVVFDTVSTYIGKADTHKSSETQQAVAQFLQIAKDYNCAVLVLRHLTKSKGGEKALYRGQGSIGFAALARVVMAVGPTPEDPNVLGLAVTKINVTKTPRTTTFCIDERPNDHSKFSWLDFTDHSSEDLLNHNPDRQGSGKVVEEAKEFLKEALDDGPIDHMKVKRMAEKRSISAKNLQRAAAALDIRRRRVDGELRWGLP